MKKLVKTAKQQFEERLDELKVIDKENTGGGFTYYLCEDKEGRCIILERGEDTFPIYSEITMSGTILDVYTDEDFLDNLVEYWIENAHEPLKRLFDWYASADKENPPFGIQTMAQLSSDASSATFSDLYEEAPDVRIITAKEQWEEASKNARKIPSHKGCTCKFEENEEGLTFYIYHFDSYESYHFPSFDELRKDGNFVSAYIGIVQKLHPEDLTYAIQWLTDGKYNMADVTLWDIKEALEGYEDEHIFFSDKVLSQEQSIEKKVFLPEIHELRDRMVEHIAQLCEKGMTIDFDSLLDCSFLLWDDMSYILPEDLSNFWLAKDKYGVWKAYRSGDGSYEYDLYDLSIYTLQHIINCLC